MPLEGDRACAMVLSFPDPLMLEGETHPPRTADACERTMLMPQLLEEMSTMLAVDQQFSF